MIVLVSWGWNFWPILPRKLGVETLVFRAFPPAYFTPLSTSSWSPLTSSNSRTLRLRLFSSAVLKLGLESSIRDALPLLLGFEAFLQSGIAGRSSHLIKHLKHIRAIPQQHSRLIPAWLIPLIPLLFSQCGISKKTETRTREKFLQLRHVARVQFLNPQIHGIV